jgi:hypothetical protein
MTKRGRHRKNRLEEKLAGQNPGGQVMAAAPPAQNKRSGYAILAAVAVVVIVAMGYRLAAQAYPSSLIPSASAAGDSSGNAAKIEGGYQVIRMNVTASGWQPDRFVLKTGVPVRWVIDGQQITGCNSGIKVPSLGLSFDIKKGLQTIEFTPPAAGTIPWSCLMGMIRGTFIVKDGLDAADPGQVQAALAEAPQAQKSGGCGCGMM